MTHVAGNKLVKKITRQSDRQIHVLPVKWKKNPSQIISTKNDFFETYRVILYVPILILNEVLHKVCGFVTYISFEWEKCWNWDSCMKNPTHFWMIGINDTRFR